MRVLLINPPPHQRVDQYDTPDFTRLGLACLAARVRADHDAAVAIVDAKFERLSHDALLDRVRAFRPDVVGLTAFTNEIKPAARVARNVKRLSSSIRTVVGGVHLSALPRETLRELGSFDLGVVGEGEATFSELLATLARGGHAAGVPNVVLRDGDEVVQSSARAGFIDLASAPMPAWDLLPRSRRVLFMTQRGCPFHCNFCMNPNTRIVRARSIDSLLEELAIISRRGAEELYVCDETLAVDKERTHRLLDAMIAAGVPRRLRWSAEVHAGTVDREILRKMKAAGCYVCGMGIESGSSDTLARMGKGISKDRIRAVRRIFAEVGLPLEGLFILGHPNETWRSAMQTLDFAAELSPERPIIGVMVPFPGTEVAQMARAGLNGYRLRSTDWNDYGKQVGDVLELEHLSRRQLELLQMIGYAKVFLAKRRFGEFARFAFKYRREGWAVLRKIALRRQPPLVDPELD